MLPPAPSPGTSLNVVTDVEKGEGYIGGGGEGGKRGLASSGMAAARDGGSFQSLGAGSAASWSSCDPLKDEGKAYAGRLEAAGVAGVHVEYPDVIHGFVTMSGALPTARRAIAEAAAALRETFER